MQKRSVLFINACVRDASRTEKIARSLLEKIGENVEEVKLNEISFPKVDEAFLEKRDSLLAEGRKDAEMFALARQFAAADMIVIAAPYWDLSFPAALKQYIEQINVSGITFAYTDAGYPVGLCRAGKLYYVTSAGGNYIPEEFGFGYIKALAENFYGIRDVEQIRAAGLDLDGADPKQIIDQVIEGIRVGD